MRSILQLNEEPPDPRPAVPAPPGLNGSASNHTDINRINSKSPEGDPSASAPNTSTPGIALAPDALRESSENGLAKSESAKNGPAGHLLAGPSDGESAGIFSGGFFAGLIVER